MSEILATQRQRVLYEARELWRNGYITFDSETTGLNEAGDDEIIQWAVCDQQGIVLGSGYIKPTVPISAGAFEVHGISSEQLADAPSFAESWPTIRELLTGKTVVIYNASFDLGMLFSSARPYDIDVPYDLFNSVCAMELFARFYGEMHEYWGTYTWQKLTTAISVLGIDVPGLAHDAAHDAAATALLIKKLAALAEQELPPGWHPPVFVPCAGCGHFSRECAEADDIWYCQQCGVEQGIFHRCPGCQRVIETPTSGVLCDDLCQYCHAQLYREKMLLTGAWHYCPDDRYRIVETPDLDEVCESCQRQRDWKRQREEAEREWQERMERERKERKRLQAKEYRARRKTREQENRRRAELGLPSLEEEQQQARAAKPVDPIIRYHGHTFEPRKDEHGKTYVYCLICEATWSDVPHAWCAGIKTYLAWAAIPSHLKTRTQLRKLRLQPAKEQQPAAIMDGYFGRYRLYDETLCVPVVRKKMVPDTSGIVS